MSEKKFIYTEKFEIEKFRDNTLKILKVWVKRFCRNSDSIFLDMTPEHVIITTEDMLSFADFSIMVESIQLNGFPKMEPVEKELCPKLKK